MPNDLPLPPELQHLLEKREAEAERRQQDRRQASTPSATDEQGPVPVSGERRRQARRQTARRHDDPDPA